MLNEIGAWLSTPEMKSLLPVLTFMVGGIAGFLARSFSTTPSERQQQRQRLFENGRKLSEQRAERYKQFTNAMQAYVNKKLGGKELNLDDFQSISTSGDLYFIEIGNACNAVLSKSVNKASRDEIVVSAVEAVNKNIGLYYETLQKIAATINVAYGGKFQRHNYESIFTVAEKYAPESILPQVRSADG